jgi:hypothetical protein
MPGHEQACAAGSLRYGRAPRRAGGRKGQAVTTSVRNNRLRAVAVVGGCVPIIAACATGFGSPTRHAIANLQAASTNLGTTLEIRDAIVALPSGVLSPKGGVAYVAFTAINLADEPDQLTGASATSASATASSAAPAPIGSAVPAGSLDIPAKTASGPGVAHLVVALEPLSAPVSQGQTLQVTLTFANSGSAANLLLPVQGASAAASPFLPSSPPAAPVSSAPAAAPVSSPPASEPPASSPASGPASPVASPSAPASPPTAASSS